MFVGITKNYRNALLDQVGFEQEFSWHKVLAGSLTGAYSHVILDGMIYETLNIFYLLEISNVLYGHILVSELYFFCMLAGLIGVILFFKINKKRPRTIYRETNESIYNVST